MLYAIGRVRGGGLGTARMAG